MIFCHPWTDSALPSLLFFFLHSIALIIFTNNIALLTIDTFRFAISYVCILSLLMILGIRFSLSWFSSVCDSWLISLPVMSMYRQTFEWPRLLWISSIILTKHKQWSNGFPGDFKIPCSISSSVTERILSRSYKRLSFFFSIFYYSTVHVQQYTKLWIKFTWHKVLVFFFFSHFPFIKTLLTG